MQYVSVNDAELPVLLDAAQRGPVTVRSQHRDVAVILSPQEYNRIRAANLIEFDSLCDRLSTAAQSRGLTEEKLAEILEK